MRQTPSPGKNIDFGLFGACGIKGGDAVADQLDKLAGGIAIPVTSQRGWTARLNYLTRAGHARQAAKAAGLTVTDRILKAWREGKQQPSRASLEKIGRAYRAVRRRNVAAHLLKRLNRDGRGTRIEVHPLDQSQVPQRHKRVLPHRELNVRRWDRLVGAWAAGDHTGLEAAWGDVIGDLGSDWGSYEYVTNVGFAA
ncbi:transcriptional regulator [Streptomyces sp. NPDC051567]|uniref:transcriptional regulator n=1 Tax=Streptomyces sp. NPDC051567 TaxID=3365660 RepID=UPI0037A29680